MSSIFHVNDKISFYENKIIDSETFEGREESRKSIAVRVSSEPFEERHILRDISGKNEGIIKYHGNYEKNNVNYIWMEYFKGTLKDVSFTEDDSKLGKDKKILLEISKAFNFLHTHLVALYHFDAGSFLQTMDGKFKISIIPKAKLMLFDCMETVSGYTAFAENIRDLGNLFKFVLTKNPTSDILYDKVLVEKLISRMTHEDPRQRITIAEVLQDSYFWDCNKKMKLINVSKKHLDLRDDVANALRLVFDGDTSIINGGLTGNLDPAILADPRLNFKNRATYKPSELLIYMRNKDEHSGEWTPELRNLFGKSLSDYMQFWEKLFPEFFNHIHEAIKAASKNNEAIRQIFKEFLFVPSAMIDSSTPCILINTSKNYDPPNQCFTNINQVELENFYRVDEKLTKFIAPISENVSLIRLIDCNQSFIGFVQIINLAKNVMSLVIDGQNVLCGYELEIKLFQKMETLKNEKTKKIHDKFEKVCDEYLTRVKKVTKMVNGTFIKLCAIILDGNLSWSPSLLENLSNTHNNILTGQTTDVIKVQKKVISEFSGLLADKDNCFAEIADELLTHLHKLINLEKRMNEQSEINMEMKGFLNDLVTSMSDSLTDSDDHIIDLFIQSLQKSLTEFAIHFESKFAQYDTPYNFIKSLLPGVLKD